MYHMYSLSNQLQVCNTEQIMGLTLMLSEVIKSIQSRVCTNTTIKGETFIIIVCDNSTSYTHFNILADGNGFDFKL